MRTMRAVLSTTPAAVLGAYTGRLGSAVIDAYLDIDPALLAQTTKVRIEWWMLGPKARCSSASCCVQVGAHPAVCIVQPRKKTALTSSNSRDPEGEKQEIAWCRKYYGSVILLP